MEDQETFDDWYQKQLKTFEKGYRENGETVSERALRLINDVPADKFIAQGYTNGVDCCCVLGHYGRLTSNDPEKYTWQGKSYFYMTLKLRHASKLFLCETGERNLGNADIAVVNNNITPESKYNETEIKDRVVHVLKDMVAAGY